MNALLAAQEKKKLQRERAKLATRATISESQANLDEEAALEGIVGSLRGPRIRKSTISSASTSPGSSRPLPHTSSIEFFFVHKNAPRAQPSLEGIVWNSDVHRQVDIQCADFWYFNIPFNVAASPYWMNFVTGITVVGKGYKAPSPADLSGRLLKDVSRAKNVVEDQKLQ